MQTGQAGYTDIYGRPSRLYSDSAIYMMNGNVYRSGFKQHGRVQTACIARLHIHVVVTACYIQQHAHEAEIHVILYMRIILTCVPQMNRTELRPDP